MAPVIARLGPVTIKWYGLMYAVALLVGLGLVHSEVQRKGLSLSWEDLVDFALLAFASGLVGARLYYVLFKLPFFWGHPWSLIGLGGTGYGLSGLAIHGGLIGGGVGFYLFVKWKNISFWGFADSVAPALILGQAFGRFGNFMNGDAYGVPTDLPWGIVFPTDTPAGAAYPHQPLHPAMLYELVLDLLIFSFLWKVRVKPFRKGFVACLYFICYSAGRSLVSFFRGDSLWVGPIRAAHLASIVLVAIFGWLILHRRLYKRVDQTGHD